MRYLLILLLCAAVLMSRVPARALSTTSVNRADSRADALLSGDAAAFSQDGKYLYTKMPDEPDSVQLWDVATGKLIRKLPEEFSAEPMFAAALSPDNRVMVALKSKVITWDVTTGKELPNKLNVADSNDSSYIVQFSADGKRLYLVTGDNKLRIQNIQTGEVIHTIPLTIYADEISISPDEKTVLVSSDKPYFNVVDVTTGTEVGTFVGEEDGQMKRALGFLPDSKTAVVVNKLGQIQQWDTTNNKLVRSVTVPEAYVDNLLWGKLSHNGNYVLIDWRYDGLNQGVLHLLDTQTGKLVQDFPAVDNGIDAQQASFAFSPDDATIAITHFGTYGFSPAQLWDVKTGHFLRRFVDPPARPISAAAFSTPLYLLLTKFVALDKLNESTAWNDYFGAGDLWKWTGGDTLTQVSHWGYNLNPVPSPDSKYIVYQSLPQTAIDFLNAHPDDAQYAPNKTLPLNIWIINTQTDEAIRVADQKPSLRIGTDPDQGTVDLLDGVVRSVPFWSPDSTKVAWLEQEGLGTILDQTPIEPRLMVYDLATQKTTALAAKISLAEINDGMPALNYVRPAWSSAGILLQSYNNTLDRSLANSVNEIIDRFGKPLTQPVHTSDFGYPGYVWVENGSQPFVGFRGERDQQWVLQDPTTGQLQASSAVIEGYNPLQPDGSTLQFDGKSWGLITTYYHPYPLSVCTPAFGSGHTSIALSPDGRLAACPVQAGDISSLLVYDRTGMLAQIRADGYRITDVSWGGLNWRVVPSEGQ